MARGLRVRVANCLKAGFWFPLFERFVNFLYTRISLGYHFKNWLTVGREAPRGAAELYQVLVILVGAMLLALVTARARSMAPPQLPTIVAGLLAAYLVSDLLIFSLHWTFVADRKLKSYRRSLATFLLNLVVEIPLLFTVLLAALGCFAPAQLPWEAIYLTLTATLSVQLVAVPPIGLCDGVAHYEVFVSVVVLGIIVASIVGAVIRKEKPA